MKFWRTPLIWFVSFAGCFCVSIAIDLACGGEVDPYDYYISFFHNNLQGEKEYRPFYFTNYQFVYDDREPQSEAEINAEEWSTYLGKEVNTRDVLKAMYHLSSRTDSVLQDGFLRTGERIPDSLAGNTFLKALKRNNGALKYYRFAKGVEKIANTTYDNWNPKPIDSIGLRYAGNTALKTALLEKDKFIQLRYYYQAQRLLHYGHAYADALKIYGKYIGYSRTPSHIKGWALALRAGELRRLKDTVQAAYLFSKVFAQYPERRVQAYLNYKFIRPKTSSVLALTTNNNEKAIVYAIDGFGNPELGLDALVKVYELEPTSPMIGVLLVREINKLEEQYLTGNLNRSNRSVATNYYVDESDKKNGVYLNHMNKLSVFCKTLASERKYPDYNIGNLAAAYIGWMQGDNAGGFNSLRALSKETLSPALNDQKQIIQLLLSAQNTQRLTDVTEAQLLPALQWLATKTKAESTPVLKGDNYDFYDDQKFTQTARNFYQQILTPAYLRQRDTAKAALALLKSGAEYGVMDFWETTLHSAQIMRIIRWKKVPSTVPFTNFLTDKLSTLSNSYLNELLGTAYLREHQYAKAVAALKLVPQTELNKNPEDYYKGDPFIDRINDYPKVYRYGKTKGYNKLQFAEAMNDVELKIKNDVANAPSYYYRYATGLYNTSHYGNASYLISYSWSSMDFGREDRYSYDGDYIKAKSAERYYLLARSLSNNEEFKAKCTFMAAKCQQKQFVMPNYGFKKYEEALKKYMADIKSNAYFNELSEKYSKTAFYKKAGSDCSYLKDFILMEK